MIWSSVTFGDAVNQPDRKEKVEAEIRPVDSFQIRTYGSFHADSPTIQNFYQFRSGIFS